MDFTVSDSLRFDEKVDRSGDCWRWTASANKKGYGKFSLGGRAKGWVQAHRFAWTRAYGPIPDEMCVLHHCDVPACVRPDHLFLGDRTANNLDASQKGRYSKHNAKITPEDAARIRGRWSEGESATAIARDYPISLRAVGFILSGRTWRSPDLQRFRTTTWTS